MFTGKFFYKETKVNKRKANDIVNDLLSLVKKQVLVGVPEATDSRKEGQGIGNAALAFIHDNGSPLQKIPARPFMQPGVKDAQDKILPEFMALAADQLEGKKENIDRRLSRIGLIVQASIRKVINEGEGFEPLKIGTLRGRLRKRKGYSKLSDERKEALMASFHPLIDTSQLRNSISYSIRSKD